MADKPEVDFVPVVAVARNGVIGVDNKLPWHVPEDLKRFKRLTSGHPIIMGRKTFESIGHPLPNRLNIVISRRGNYSVPEGVKLARSIDEAAEIASHEKGLAYIIGGAEVYRETLPRSSRIHMTVIDAEFRGDAVFPALDLKEWRVSSAEVITAETNNIRKPIKVAFVTLDRPEQNLLRLSQEAPDLIALPSLSGHAGWQPEYATIWAAIFNIATTVALTSRGETLRAPVPELGKVHPSIIAGGHPIPL